MKPAHESREHYRKAYALAKRILLEKKKLRRPLTPVALDTLLDENMVSCKKDLGILEIPTNLIIGVAVESGFSQLYTKDFLPVSVPESNFADRWCSLYEFLHDNAVFENSISCYEYLGKFYVRDGMKRVSVANYSGVSCISAHVIRILPLQLKSREVSLYYDFLYQYRLTKLYQLQFTQTGFFEELQIGLNLKATHRWSDRDRTYFMGIWPRIEHAFQKSYEGDLLITAADALVVVMRKYSFEQIASMESWLLARVFQTFGKELYALSMSVKSAAMEDSAVNLQQSA